LRKSGSWNIFCINDIYIFSMILRLSEKETLLVIIVRLLLSAQIKLAMILDFMSFSILLMFATCLLNRTMNFVKLAWLIRTRTYLLDSHLEIMLILGLSFLGSLMTLWTSSIFEDDRPGKFSLIFTICLILETDAYAYDWLFWLVFSLFLWRILIFQESFGSVSVKLVGKFWKFLYSFQ